MLDHYIDGLAASAANTGGTFSPFGRAGSVVNVVICAGLIAGGLWAGFSNPPFGFVVAGVGATLEIVFVRVAFRARRGDFDSL